MWLPIKISLYSDLNFNKLNAEDTGLKLRDAAFEDAQLLFDWANDEEVRNNSINQGQIKWDNHVHWLKLKLSDLTAKIFILENNDNPVAQIRIDQEGAYWTIDYSVDKAYRGKGYGKIIVTRIIEKYPSYPFRAVVKKNNIASRKVFENLGFKHCHSEDDNLYLYEYQHY